MQNLTQIKQYQNQIFSNILSSQFVYSAISQKCEFKCQQLIIQQKKTKKIHYLYLFLTTKRKPYAKKGYIFSKNLKKKTQAIRTQSKAVTWIVEIEKSNFYENISFMLFQIIPFQNNSEKKILRLQENNIVLFINYAPLTNHTQSLKSKNSYISDIPLMWRLKWTNSSLFQKIFVLKHLKILNENFQFPRLENDNNENNE